ncbi:MAG: SAM-dependent methyltransferase [Candidatus Heimdallarchaeota archaeon]|nr:MAG: SAM-dependent methyltransferase [Candidatus Heimdallarchaeota archaeon]
MYQSENKPKLTLFGEEISISPEFLRLLEKLRLRIPDSQKRMRETSKFMQTIDFSAQIISHFKKYKKPIKLLDCACGNSYLSFILYYLLTEIYYKQVRIIGVDVQENLIDKCNKISEEMNFDGLEFHCADINNYSPKDKIDGIYALHACDIATDYAIAKTINLKATAGFYASCCHRQISSQVLPEKSPFISELLRNTPFKEKVGAFITDTTRQLLLEGFNYRTKIFEFTPVRWTDKNIMLKAELVGKPSLTPKINAYYTFISKHQLKSILSNILKTSLDQD